jgi:hypothetical protein
VALIAAVPLEETLAIGGVTSFGLRQCGDARDHE